MTGGEAVLVAGAGAVGSVIGGLLARAGLPVTLLGRPAHLSAVGRDGLRIEGLFGEHRVNGLACATDAGALRGPFRFVLLTVKAWDTARVAAAVAPVVAEDGFVVSMQNGLGNLEAVAAAVGAPRVLGARVIFGAELAAPGRVRVTVMAEPVLVGSPDPADAVRTAAAASLAERLAAAGVPAEPTSALLAELWAKVFYNAALNPLGALLGVPYGALADDADARAVMDDVIREAFAVALAAGVALRWPDVEAYRAAFYQRLVPPTASHRSSMLQDLERGRPTEIDALNGYVARCGTDLGLATRRMPCSPTSSGPGPAARTRTLGNDEPAATRTTRTRRDPCPRPRAAPRGVLRRGRAPGRARRRLALHEHPDAPP
jgi:2-dehydropantoate 2-reductase